LKTAVKSFFIPVLLMFALVIFSACGSNEASEEPSDNNTTDEVSSTQKDQSVAVEIPPFEEYVKQIRGGSFIKKAELKNGVVTVEYYGDYEEYKKDKPESNVSSDQFYSYWGGHQQTQKRLEMNLAKGFTESLRLARMYPDKIDEIKMVIPARGKTYEFEATRSELEQFFGIDMKTLNEAYKQGDSSLSKYIDPVVYEDEKRKQFLESFVNEQ